MSGSVDDEVVRMRFDSNGFERGVAGALSLLGRLKSALSFSGADKGLDNIEAKANKFSLAGMSTGVDGISKKFLALSTVAITALSNITNRAVNAGISLAKSFTIDPLKEGFTSYQTQINAAKTIISNTGARLPEVERQLGQLQTYANQTVYSFSDMAQNIGTFTAAGVKLTPAVQAIKGLGNSAALSGSTTAQLNTAMYQMSQALATGTIRLQDWNSLSNAGLGGQNIQNALKATASTITGTGPKMDAAIKKYGSFRESLQSGWLTGDVFNKTMGVMAGQVDKATGKTVAFSVAQLKAKGYTQAQAVQLNKLSQAAIESATQIRTYDQLTAALKEEVGTAWGNVFKAIFGNLNAATVLFTGIHNVAENALTKPINDLAKLLQGAAALGARAKAIDAFKNVFHALGAVIAPVKAAFREIFPAQTAAGLAALITRFDDFTKRLKIGADTANNIKRTFAGFFAILDIGKQIVMAIFHEIGQLIGVVAGGSGGFLSFTGSVGDMIVAFDQALKKGGLIQNFFHIIGNVLQIPLHLFQLVGVAIGQLFSGFKPKDGSRVSNSVVNAGTALGKLAIATQKISAFFGSLGPHVANGVKAVVNAFSGLGKALASALGSGAFSNVLQTIQVGLLGAITLLIRKFFKSGFGGINVDLGGGVLGKMGAAFDGLTGNLKAMQAQLKAKTLLDIAIAVGILAASVVALSLINSARLATALKAMAVGFGELLGAMAILTKISGSAGFIKIPLMAASLDLLAGAILLLTASVMLMSRLSWAQLEKGLTAVGVLLLAISVASYPLSANSAGMVRAGVGIAAIAVALNLLYFAVKNFASMKWSDIIKGLSAVGIALIGIAVIMRAMPKGMAIQAVGLLAISVALNALYLAVKNFASISYGDMVHGLVGVGGALLVIAGAMQLMPPGMIAQAVALNLIALALLSIGKAVANMSKLSWPALAKGLAGLAGALVILAGALFLMEGSLGGAAALLVVAAALHIFVPALMALASMSWGSIAKGFIALAGSFAIIGVAGLLLTPVIPSLLALGVALGLVGVAMLAFGAGAALLGTGLTAIAAAGGAAIGVLLGGLKGLIALLPTLATNLATALVSFITIIGKNAPAIVGAFVSILNQLLQAVPKILPSLITAINALVVAILSVLTTNAPKIIQAGLTLLLDLLKGIRDNIGKIVDVVASIIVNFLNALARNMGRIINAGVNLLAKFLIGIASALGRMPGIVLQVIAAFITSLLGNFPKILSMGGQMLGKLVSGILGGIGRLASAGISLIGRFIGGLASGPSKAAAAGSQMIGRLISGVTGGLGRLFSAGYNLASSIISGITSGIKGLVGNAVSAVKGAVSSVVGAAGKFLHIGGPSKIFIGFGEGISGGMAIGIDNAAGSAVDSVRGVGKQTVLQMKKNMAGLASVISDSNLDYNPTVSPVLDLSQFSKDATQMQGLVSVSPVTPSVSFDQASSISAAEAARQEAASSSSTAEAAVPVVHQEFNQNNYSPKALSTADIYRNSKNLLSQAKGAAGVPVVPTNS